MRKGKRQEKFKKIFEFYIRMTKKQKKRSKTFPVIAKTMPEQWGRRGRNLQEMKEI